MVSERGAGGAMPCESCGVQFSVFRRKRACGECERLHCAACLRRGGGVCAPCRALAARPLQRAAIQHLKARDLQCFLQRQNVSTRGCVEKEELVTLCVAHVNSAAYRRRSRPSAGAGAASGPFTALKGLTNNLNEFISSAFDLRASPPAPTPRPHPHPPAQQPQQRGNCFNATHAHSPTGAAAAPPRERFNPRPGGEPDVRVPGVEVDAVAGGGGVGAGGAEPSRSASVDSAPVDTDTADCFEIEDLDDSGWEFVTRPADPLPNDSEVLMTAPECVPGGGGVRAVFPPAAAPAPCPRAGPSLLPAPRTPQRAASELELHRAGRPAAARAQHSDSTSLQDEPLMDTTTTEPPAESVSDVVGVDGGVAGRRVSLEQVSGAAQLAALNVKQLKELLARNRVEYRGCLERAELLERAHRLWEHHAKYKDEVDKLPLEECCKICMAAPLECVLLECGHIAACTACAKQLAECPICRQYVVRAVRFFRS